MKVKTSELAGAALDWAVAKCEGITGLVLCRGHLRYPPAQFSDEEAFTPSTDWAQGGPIIEREQIEVSPWNTDEAPDRQPYGFLATSWRARSLREFMYDAEGHHANTPLIAAMRCFVASKLGDEVDVPEELMQ